MDTEKAAGPRWSAWRVLVILGLIAGLVAVWASNGEDSSSAGSTEPSTSPRSVKYRLTGDASGADLTWMDGNGQTAQANGKAVPLSGDVSFSARAGAFLYFSAQNTGAFGSLTCQIVVDGEVVAENTSSGGYAIVSCEATVTSR